MSQHGRPRSLVAYNALQTHVEKRMSHGLMVGFSFTYSHATDEQSALGLFYGSSDFDRSHVGVPSSSPPNRHYTAGSSAAPSTRSFTPSPARRCHFLPARRVLPPGQKLNPPVFGFWTLLLVAAFQPLATWLSTPKKLLAISPRPCYPLFAFVALVSPLKL